MKHFQKEYYSCDRCGKDINEIPSDSVLKRILHIITCKPLELETLTVNRTGYIIDTKLILPNVVSIEICEYYNENRKKIHLCGKCRKDFEEFMKNESVEMNR